MTTYERRQSLLDLLRKQPGLRVPEIAVALEVSEGTVRNDVERPGGRRASHPLSWWCGADGAKEFSEHILSERHREHAVEKEAIARYAADLVQDGEKKSILLDASSTIYYFALALKSKQRLRVVTNGLDVARLLALNPIEHGDRDRWRTESGWILCDGLIQRAGNSRITRAESFCVVQWLQRGTRHDRGPHGRGAAQAQSDRVSAAGVCIG